jgi:hypothetical protein
LILGGKKVIVRQYGHITGILCPARDWEILNCIKLTQHYKMH